MCTVQKEVRVSLMVLATDVTETFDMSTEYETISEWIATNNPHDGDVIVCDYDTPFDHDYLESMKLSEIAELATAFDAIPDGQKDDFVLKINHALENVFPVYTHDLLKYASNLHLIKDAFTMESVGTTLFELTGQDNGEDVPELYKRFFDYKRFAESYETSGMLHQINITTWILDTN